MECSSCPMQILVNAFAEADIDRNMGRCQSKRLKEACKKLQEAMQNVCLTCVDEVNDNNPSNHGQTLYSLDSGHCQSGVSRPSSTHTDTNEVLSRADWINSHAAYDSAYYQDSSYRPYSGESPIDGALRSMRSIRKSAHSEKVSRDSKHIAYETTDEYNGDAFFDADEEEHNPFQDEFSITTLPSPVEAILLREMNNFAALPPLHQMLVCSLLAGMNISDFARMGWLPKEIRKLMKPKTKDMEVISAQTAHAIYQNICKKLPYMTVLARATKKRSKERIASQKSAVREFQRANSHAVKYLASPSAMRSVGKPTKDPHLVEDSSDDNLSRKSRRGRRQKDERDEKYHQEAFL